MRFIVCLSLLLSLTSFGQESEAQLGKLGINVGYFGEFVLHPGMYAGVDYSVWSNKRFDAHWNSEIGFYIHKWNNNSFFAQSSFGIRYTTSFSMLIDLNVGVGYMLSLPNGDVYQVDPTGNLVLKGRPATSHFKPHLSLLFGWNGRSMMLKTIPGMRFRIFRFMLVMDTQTSSFKMGLYNRTEH